MNMPADTQETGHLATNIAHFARALRTCGLKIGPATILDAIVAVEAAGIGTQSQFRAVLRSVLVSRKEDLAVFEDAFQLFWRSPDMTRKIQTLMSPLSQRSPAKEKSKPGRTRVSTALMPLQQRKPPQQPGEETHVDASQTASAFEVLKTVDFAQMTLSELDRAKAAIEKLALPDDLVKTRRLGPSHSGRIDPRASMRASLAQGGDVMIPRFRQRRQKPPPLVFLADISGSMSDYTRILLHFVHMLSERRPQVSTFLFGTRLSNVSRQLRSKDPDQAMDECATAVRDWSGGTRIGQTLKEFNRLWARRVLAQGAVVLLITDGLEHQNIDLLEKEINRLHRSCRRLIWLNPLLRYDMFQPNARGIRAMLPHVDEFRPVHNLASLQDLVNALNKT
ncbi:VWA domain-containing protein [Labrenzia sp. 011]|uniref:vWA domain-containing protein n=1 Tax=Labrenzia sp. 011 TaxID=2171494 RepID=UPI000D506466|nr:VWA domain-containing protein [Labrenzia sp. 011]PVB59659.1 VWA domain-containing protein [Labrenzia sp. 011]